MTNALSIFMDGNKWVHIALACLCLVAFPLALFVKKGGRIHTRSGRVYLVAGLIVGASSVVAILVRSRTFTDFLEVDSSNSDFGLMKLSLTMALLASVELWNGWAALKLLVPGKVSLPRSNLYLNLAVVVLCVLNTWDLFLHYRFSRAVTSAELLIIHVIFYGVALWLFKRSARRSLIAVRYFHVMSFVASGLIMLRSFLGGGPARFVFPEGSSHSTRIAIATIFFSIQVGLAFYYGRQVVSAANASLRNPASDLEEDSFDRT